MNKRNLYLLIFSLLTLISIQKTNATDVVLSSEAKISLITCAPGDEVYSFFGHSAIRVCDPQERIDVAYNYGTFSYKTENFYWKFIRRELDYYLSKDQFVDFVQSYIYEDREVIEHPMHLDSVQIQHLFDALEENYLPENKCYRYDFFFDNCATRIRDKIEVTLADELVYNFEGMDSTRSFRSIVEPYINRSPWLDIGINIGFGIPVDRAALPREMVLIPEYLMKILERATIVKNGKKLSLLGEKKIIYKQHVIRTTTYSWFVPGIVFWAVVGIALIITFFGFLKNRRFVWFDVMWFFLCGLCGLFLIFLWFFTAHGIPDRNLDLLWAVPTHIIFVFMMVRGKRKISSYYFLISGAIAGLVLLVFPFISHSFHECILPILIVCTVRSLNYYRITRKPTI